MFNWMRLFIIVVVLSLLTGCQRHNNIVQGYIEGYYTYLSSNSEGFLQTLKVARGDVVKSGQTLFVLESQPEAYQVEQAQEKLQQAEFDLSNLEKGQRYTILKGIEEQLQQASADLDYAKVTYYRNQQLVKTSAVSRADYDQAKANFDRANARFKELMANFNEAKLGARTDVIASAEAAVNAAVTQANIASWYLAKKSIGAPGDGTVNDTFYREGELVPAGRPIVSMLIPADVRVIFYVPEPSLGKIAIGNTVTVNCDGCAKSFDAKINYIGSQAEYTPPFIFSEKERAKFVYRVEAVFNDIGAKAMHPGQPVDVTLKIAS